MKKARTADFNILSAICGTSGSTGEEEPKTENPGSLVEQFFLFLQVQSVQPGESLYAFQLLPADRGVLLIEQALTGKEQFLPGGREAAKAPFPALFLVGTVDVEHVAQRGVEDFRGRAVGSPLIDGRCSPVEGGTECFGAGVGGQSPMVASDHMVEEIVGSLEEG